MPADASKARSSKICRRTLLQGSALQFAATGIAPPLGAVSATAAFKDLPIELEGDWGRMIPRSVLAVLERARECCLRDVPTRSDREPERLRVELRQAQPSIWLHRQPSRTAWIIVSVGERDWSRLAYQFGHELGHVLANSWEANAKPLLPCQWLEEALVEAFSIRGLGILAESWSIDPPFRNDNAFGTVIQNYSRNIIVNYSQLNGADANGFPNWFSVHRTKLESFPGLDDFSRAAALVILDVFSRDPSSIADIAALNRWQERASLPLPLYISKWIASCEELGLAGALPRQIMKLTKLRR